jgi:DNA-binding MarR family transcriptional regulator
MPDRPHWNLLLLLKVAFDKVEAAMLERLHAHGFGGIRAAHGQVFATITPEGSRIGEMAARGGITQQSMSELVDALERLGYVVRQPDPRDRRAKIVKLTRQGRQVADTAIKAVDEIEREWAARMGKQRAAALRAALEVMAFEDLGERRRTARQGQPNSAGVGPSPAH